MVGNRQHIPEPMKQQWITMSAHMSSSDIVCVTHLSHYTVDCALRLSHLTGSVVQRPLQAGHPHLLMALNAAVSHTVVHVTLLTSSSQYLEACVECTPDILLLELHTA
jgi:hypothetical protein